MKTFHHYHFVLGLGMGIAVLGAVAIIATSNFNDLSFAQNAPGEVLSILNKQYPLENPDLAINKAGDIVIVWQERKNMDYEVFAMKGKLDNLTAFSEPVQVNNYKQGNQARPRVAMNEKGQAVVVWESAGQDRSGSGVYARRLTASMKINGPEIQVHKTTLDSQGAPDVAMNESGAFTVVWTSETGDGKSKRIYMQNFDTKGKRRGNETKVDNVTLAATTTMANPHITMLGTGEMIVTWENVKSGSLIDVAAQVFDAAGAPKTSADIVVNATSAGKNFNPNVITFGADQFLITWENDIKASEFKAADFQASMFKNLDISYENIKGRKVKIDGTMGDEINYSQEKNINSNNTPELVATGNGAVVVWQERKKASDKADAKTQWFMQAQEIDSTGKTTGGLIPLTNGKDVPYSNTRASSNGIEKMGILWSEKENGTSKSKIQFRPWTLQITPKAAEEASTAAPEETAGTTTQ